MSGVPSNIIIPFIGVDFETVAGPGAAEYPLQALIIGQKIAAGTGTAETPYLVSSADEVRTLAGAGSQAHRMAVKFFQNVTTVPCYLIMLADAGGAAASTYPITLSGTATAAGEIALYFNGTRIATSVAVGDAADTVGAAMAAAIALETEISATAAYDSGSDTLTFTAKNKGVVAGDMDIRLSANVGESIPAGITVTLGSQVAGTGDPDVQDAIDAIGDLRCQIVANPYTDATNLGKVQTYAATQWGATVQKGQVWIGPKRDTRANLITMGTTTATYNSKHVSTPAWYKRLEATYEGAGALAGAVAQSLIGDVGQPLHRLAVAGITALAQADRWTAVERNQLAVAGIATLSDAVGVQLEAPVTMYLKNSAGASDASYQLIGDVIKLDYSRYDFVTALLLKYPSARLANSSANIREGLQVMTPAIGKMEALAWFRRMENLGIFEGYDAFKSLLTCTRNQTNNNRMDWGLPVDLVNAFMVGSATIKFKL